MSSTEIYKKNSWTFAASLPQGRSEVSAAALDNSVFVFGEDNVFHYQSVFIVY